MAVSPKLTPKSAASPEQTAATQELAILDAFAKMDFDGDGRVSPDEFRRFLTNNPKGWPLGELLEGQSREQREQIITFWFRRLDVLKQGSFDANELIAFFRAMKDARYQETMYAEFLLNMFDANLDGKLSESEFRDMLKVMLGADYSDEVASRHAPGANGMNREDLIKLLHRISCDFANIGRRNSSGSDTVLVVSLLAVGIAAAAGAVYYMRRR